MPCLPPLGGDQGATVIVADCIEAMRVMPGGCVDAVVTDPPARMG